MRTVIVARLTDDDVPARIRELAPEQTRQVLAANCFTPHDEFWQQSWLVPRMTPDTDLRRRAGQLTGWTAAQTHCFEVSFGIRNPLGELDHALLNFLGSPR